MIEGHNLVKPSDDFRNEVATTSEKIAMQRYNHFVKIKPQQVVIWPS